MTENKSFTSFKIFKNLLLIFLYLCCIFIILWLNNFAWNLFFHLIFRVADTPIWLSSYFASYIVIAIITAVWGHIQKKLVYSIVFNCHNFGKLWYCLLLYRLLIFGTISEHFFIHVFAKNNWHHYFNRDNLYC